MFCLIKMVRSFRMEIET